MSFIKIPNLPESDIVLAAVSGTYRPIIEALNKKGIEAVEVKACKNLSDAVNAHADMLMHHLGENKVVLQKGQDYLKCRLEEHGFDVIPSYSIISNIYPKDVILNAARVGNYLFCRPDVLDSAIRDYCERNRVQIVAVKQGYSKCSTAIVNENSVITSDPSIYTAAKKVGLDVLKIRPGYIQLDGYEYGFIGGTCGLIGKNKLAFTGDIRHHPDYKEIYSFCLKKNIEITILTNGMLMDIGGILPLKCNTY